MSIVDNKVSHSFDKRSKKATKATVGSTENLKHRTEEDRVKSNFGYKPPLHGNNRGFAAQMMKNKNKYFNKNSPNNFSINTGNGHDSDGTPKYGGSSTAEVRNSQKYAKNYLNFNEQDSTSINDSESETNGKKMNNKISHHARIKDKLKLLKSNLRNQS